MIEVQRTRSSKGSGLRGHVSNAVADCKGPRLCAGCSWFAASGLDLIAVPWVESASDAVTLIRAIRQKTRTVTQHENADRKWHKDCNPTQKPHGRVAYSLHVTNSGMYGGYLDISVMPRVKKRRGSIKE